MSAKIRVAEKDATISDYHWISDFEPLETVLNSMLDPNGPSSSDPNPNYSAALQAVNIFGGKVVSYDPVDSEPGRIY